MPIIQKLVVFLLILTGFPPVAVFAAGPDGKQLFDQNCVVCHRKGGQGSIGLPLRKEKFSTFTNEYIRQTIRHGRPGRVMPPFEIMSDSQVDAIVSYLREWSGQPEFKDDGFVAIGDAENGLRLFKGHCAQCHGDKGQAIGQGTGQSYSRQREFTVIPPAIGNSGFLVSVSDGMLKEIIMHGRRGTVMPAYGKLGFSEQDVEDVIIYLRSFPTLEQVEAEQGDEYPDPSIVVESPHDFDTTVENLKQALSGYNFRIFPDRYLEQSLYPEWEVNKKQLTIRYCNFNQLYDILKIEPRLGMALPCRIAVVENEEGQVHLIAMNMALIARLFNNRQLEDIAVTLNSRQLEILEEVTF